MHMSIGDLGDQSSDLPEAGVTGYCAMPDVGAGNKFITSDCLK